jgi:hypothetical protein
MQCCALQAPLPHVVQPYAQTPLGTPRKHMTNVHISSTKRLGMMVEEGGCFVTCDKASTSH